MLAEECQHGTWSSHQVRQILGSVEFHSRCGPRSQRTDYGWWHEHQNHFARGPSTAILSWQCRCGYSMDWRHHKQTQLEVKTSPSTGCVNMYSSCSYRAGFWPRGCSTVPRQGYNDVALLSSPVDDHLIMRVVQVGLQETEKRQKMEGLKKRNKRQNVAEKLY